MALATTLPRTFGYRCFSFVSNLGASGKLCCAELLVETLGPGTLCFRKVQQHRTGELPS